MQAVSWFIIIFLYIKQKSLVSMAIITYRKGTNFLCRTFELCSKNHFYNRASLLRFSTFNISAPSEWKSTKSGMVNKSNPEINCVLMGHGPNPNHLGDQRQWKCHFWISMVSAISFFSKLVRSWDVNHKIQIDFSHRRVPQNISWRSAIAQLRLKKGQNS